MKNIIFSIYRYSIRKQPGSQTDYTVPNNLKPSNYDSLEAFFESYFPHKGSDNFILNFNKSTKKDMLLEKEEHKTLVLEHRDNIVLFQIQANTTKSLSGEDWVNHKEPHHPFCNVIIDNRPGRQYIAIEHAAMDVDKTAHIIEAHFQKELNKAGLSFKIVSLYTKLEFFEAIKFIKNTLGVNASKLTFEFDKHLEEKKELSSRFLHALNEWIGRFADSGQVSANITDDERLEDEIIREDLRLISELCYSNPKYHLSVMFKNFGIYRYGHDIYAQFGLTEDVLDLFVNPPENKPKQLYAFEEEEKKPITSLDKWLDDIKKLFEKHEEISLFDKKRSRPSRI